MKSTVHVHCIYKVSELFFLLFNIFSADVKYTPPYRVRLLLPLQAVSQKQQCFAHFIAFFNTYVKCQRFLNEIETNSLIAFEAIGDLVT